MSANSKIEWTDHTFNPWWGCTKVGPDCDHCYAEALDKRTGGARSRPRGLVLAGPRACPFVPALGQLGYFRWSPADATIVPPPAKWMQPQPARIVETPAPGDSMIRDLLTRGSKYD